MNSLIRQRISESILVKNEILNNDELLNRIENISHEIINCIKSGNKVIFAGNGGSFSDFFHLAG